MAKNDPPWRRAFDALEEPLRKRAEELASTEEFGRAVMTAFGAWTSVARGARSASTSLLHSANLPAHADLRRLTRQVGALEGKIDRLALQIEKISERLDALAGEEDGKASRSSRARR